jgi:hypothetical protein
MSADLVSFTTSYRAACVEVDLGKRLRPAGRSSDEPGHGRVLGDAEAPGWIL